MKLSPRLITVISLLCLPLIGCDQLKGPEGPAGPRLSGDLIGFSTLYDITGQAITDRSGIKVTVEGTSITSITGADGRWTLSGLMTGTYTIDFTKTNYGLRKLVGLQFVGGGQAYYGTVSLWELPKFNIIGLTASTSSGSINVNGNLTGTLPAATRSLILFFGTTNAVSSDPANYLYTYFVSVSSFSSSFSTTVSGSSLTFAGIPSGSMVYIVAYSTAYSGSSSYVDFATGRRVYTELGSAPSNVASVVVP